MNTSHILSVRQLRYRRSTGQTPVFEQISFDLSAGEILCLLGPNGAGKTTLMRCLIGALQHETGEVLINGKRLHDHPHITREVARCMAYVPQASGDSGLSLLDIVLMGRTPHLPPLSVPGQNDRQIAHAAMKRIGIHHLADHPFNRVSGGERQLALIARALAQQPRLLIMDEPTASLDLGNQARVLCTIRDLSCDGLAILVTTHQPEHALLLDARVVTLQGGRLASAGRARDVLRAAELSTLYGTPLEVIEHRGSPAACIPRL